MKLLKTILCLLALLSPPALAAECVILLHGLARTDASMEKLEKKLGKKGYQVVNQDYPSRKYSVETLAADIVPLALEECGNEVPINFVTHSLGGIILRQYLHTEEVHQLKRVVMLGPPNQGSQVVNAFRKVPGFDWFFGPAALQLGTDNNSITKTLGPAYFDVGIIAGTRTINLILSLTLPNPDDGIVSVESTELEGMVDHITFPASHHFMMNKDAVIDQVLQFLEVGEFDHGETGDGKAGTIGRHRAGP